MVRTRFAPSPTGYLHIGGVRTALFNWLLARHAGGQFILRIDDTDAERNVGEAIQPILDGFRWLGLQWDEGPEVGGPHWPYFQSQRGDRHREAAQQLLARGFAYRDYGRPDEFQQLREEAQQRGEPFVYDRRWMAEDDAAAARFEAEGRSPVVRLKMPRKGQCVIQDLVRGEVRVDWASEPDHVIQRGDGSCLYHLASVVDDQDMEITHIVRAAEHLSNTPRQIFILESLGYARPQYAHLPYVAEPGGTSKLSKRKLAKYEKNKDFAELLTHGRHIAERCGLTPAEETFNPVIIDFYREIGFLPEAILNYLLLLGWSFDGEREKFTPEQMVELFSLQRVNKAPASFGPQKLLAFQADQFAELPLQQRVERARPFAQKAGFLKADGTDGHLAEVVRAAGDRLKLGGDIVAFDYCFLDDFAYDEKAFHKRLVQPEDARDLLGRLRDRLAETESFDAASTERAVKEFCESAGIKLGQIIHALRIATTGVPSGFGMFETLEILGRDRSLARIDAALQRAAARRTGA